MSYWMCCLRDWLLSHCTSATAYNHWLKRISSEEKIKGEDGTGGHHQVHNNLLSRMHPSFMSVIDYTNKLNHMCQMDKNRTHHILSSSVTERYDDHKGGKKADKL